MDYALDRFEQQVRQAIAATGKVRPELIELAQPKSNIPADLAFPAFRAAKEQGIAPPQLAQQLAATIQTGPDTLVGGVAAAGPFLNFSLDTARLVSAVLEEIERLGPQYGGDDLGQNQPVVVEYSSPNIARRMHVGHIRSTIIGQAIHNILRFLGYHTIADNHLGDYGKQFGTLLAAIERFGKPEGEGEAVLAEIESLYARYNKLIGGNEDVDDPDAEAADDVARAWSLKLEQRDPQARELWQWMVDATIQANRRNYERLNVHFDTLHGESFYADMLPNVIAQVEELDVAERDEKGALAVVGLHDRNGKELPSFLVQRSDGGTLYLTRDLATVIYRESEYHPKKMIYIVGQPQELHFRQVFALVRALGYAQDVELVHIYFGTVFNANGEPFSMRRGNVLYLEALLNEAHTRARAVVEQASPELSEAEKDAVAEAVGVGAVIYNDLYQDTKRNITLDWDRMLALEGNSAPYIQYMHARCRSILRRAASEDQRPTTNDQRPHDSDDSSSFVVRRSSDLLTHSSEIGVVKQLAKLPAAVREAGERYAPFVIAEWLYEMARALSAFYRDCPVLRAETPELRAARLRLVAATAQALENGLRLLGIRAPERM
ncbi:MAG TPA: arginine--tRNA ligase [Roseiflexaceae bacterium]|nr:arginine--tRNA ligase [Roseiflexaceae bacterium]